MIDAKGLDEEIRCAICRNQMKTDRGCDGNCQVDEKLCKEIIQILEKHLSSAQPVATDTNVGDTISQQAAIELAMKYCPDDDGTVQCGGDIRELLDELENLPSAVAPRNDDYTEFIEELLSYEERNDMFNLTTKERAEFQAYVRERMEL